MSVMEAVLYRTVSLTYEGLYYLGYTMSELNCRTSSLHRRNGLRTVPLEPLARHRSVHTMQETTSGLKKNPLKDSIKNKQE